MPRQSAASAELVGLTPPPTEWRSLGVDVGWDVRVWIDEIFTTEYFGPILGVHVYDDADYASVMQGMEYSAPYGLTGASSRRTGMRWRRRRSTCGSRQGTST
ncbi:hypothetical protein [Kribbella sp. NPDC006257]|uniref:hypothetical protein n=1 Tax=Kribbella sp. NPDC006257 TaxID=3156738 RepID=UPI0033AC9CD6